MACKVDGNRVACTRTSLKLIYNIPRACLLKDVRGWQFLTMKAAETLYIVCLPLEKHIS